MFKESVQYVIELDNAVYRLSEGNLSSVEDLNGLNGNKWIISDLHDTVSRTDSVQAPARYAEIVVRKKLLDSGELDGSPAVFTHLKKQKQGNTTDVFYTAMPSRLVEHNFDRIKKDNNCVLLFPLYTVLYAALKDIGSEDPVAVMFQHERFIDLVIGTKKKIYHAHRCTVPELQITSMWNMAFAETGAAETENSISVNQYYVLTWLDSSPLPALPGNIQKKIVHLEEEPVMFNGDVYHMSFPRALRMLNPTGRCCISPLAEKIAYVSEKCLPFLTLFLFVSTLFLAGGYFFYNSRARALGKEAAEIKHRIDQMLIQSREEGVTVAYTDQLDLVSGLSLAKRALPYGQIVNDVSGILPDGMRVDSFRLDYESSRINASVSGRIKLPFDLARKEYQTFIKRLKDLKYGINDKDFKVRVNKYKFNVDFEKKI